MSQTLDWEQCYAGLPTGFQTPEQERRPLEERDGKGAANYGEIEPHAASRLLAWLRPGPDDLLLDLGSGCGRLLLQAVCETELGQAVGIEGLSHRHAVACRAQARLRDLAPARAARLEFCCADFCRAPLPDATLVYLGATCFPDPLLARVARRLLDLPRLHRLVCTRPLPEGLARSFETVGQLRLDMSWTPEVAVEVYAARR